MEELSRAMWRQEDGDECLRKTVIPYLGSWGGRPPRLECTMKAG